jgi:hypothetical protein
MAGQYKNFDVAIYIPVSIVQQFANSEKLNSDWNRISNLLKVDKVYIEVQRNRDLASDDLLEQVKKFFLEKGVRVAGGMTLSDSDGSQFRSFCYTNPDDRQFIKATVELAARHFDEIIQDDFFFVTTKYDSDIAAKGSRSWTQFRLDLMREASENLLIKPAKAVNPKVKMVIKYPNWYEHFQGLGFDLEKQSQMFDGIYTGTETRDPEVTDQSLQEYESYLIFRYFENIKPGANHGGWVDTFSIRFVDRYVEQLWDTVFAKAPEIMLFEWSGLTRSARPGQRSKWQDIDTSFNYAKMQEAMKARDPNHTEPIFAGVAAYSLEQADAFLDKLGKPIGIKSYKPYHSWGEDFLHNYFGNLGIPIDLYPEFPADADMILLTECAKSDPDIIAKIKKQLVDGKSVVITSGLLNAMQGKGIEDILEVQYTNRKFIADQYLTGFGAGSGSALGTEENPEILFPDIRFLTNDSWPVIRAISSGRGYPLMLMNRYSKGILYVWILPDNFNDLYRLPASVTSSIKDYIMAGFPVRLDGQSRVALFAYDNNTFIVQSYRDTETDVTVSLANEFTTIKNLVTNEIIKGRMQSQGPRQNRRDPGAQRMTFNVHLLPHSYAVFAAQKEQ